MSPRPLTVAALVLFPTLAGCPAPGVYRTARTLNRGSYDLGLMVSGTYYASPGVTGVDFSGQTVTSPPSNGVALTLIPEFSAHYGLTDDLEVGGRLAPSSLLAEVDVKLRVLGNRSSHAHLALAPAFGWEAPYGGYPLAFLLMMVGPRATLPLIYTQDVSNRLAINLAAYGSYRQFAEGSPSSGPWVPVAGGSLGVEVRFPRFYLMPLVDVSRTLTSTPYPYNEVESQTWVTVGLALGAIPRGR
jgi:hypothetical protein